MRKHHTRSSGTTGLLRTALLVLLFHASAPGAAQDHWQLDLAYRNDGSLELLGAALLPPSPKAVRSPGARGALFAVPVTISWLDPAGTVLCSTETTLPLGTRTPAQEGSSEPGTLLPEQAFTIRIPGPGPAEQAAHVKVTGTGDTPPAPLLPEQVLALPTANTGDPLPGPPVAVTTKIQDTGDDANRLVLVVLGDGYTQAEIDDGSFSNDVALVVARFGSQSPWDAMMSATNIYQVSYPSVESGSDYEDGPPGTGTLKNTYYQTGFWTGGIERLLAPTSTGTSRCIAVANNFVGLGVWDQIILIVNSSKYGGAGGTIATNSMHSAGPEISIHEIGHSLVGLADEYDYSGGATYSGPPPSEANVDTDPLNPKWSHWIEPGTPLPTPDTFAYSSTVGAFEGARYHSFGIYRPWRACRMNVLGQDFCPVCTEEHLKTFFSYVNLTDDVDPSAGSTVNVSSSASLTVSPLAIPDLTYTWRKDGIVLPSATTPTLALSSASLDAASQEISLEMNYASPLMRIGAPSDHFSWTVQNTGETANGIPHWWLVREGLPVTDGTDTIDHDGDGETTGNEFYANTDPNDRNSLLRISEIRAPTATTPGLLRWKTELDRIYRLEFSIDLEDWDTVSGYNGITGNGDFREYEIPVGSDPTLYYRVEARLP